MNGRSLLARWRKFRRPGVIRHYGVKLSIDPGLTPALVRSLHYGFYEEAEQHMLRQWLTPDEIVMELGTGLGFISILAARIVGAHRVHTFEALPAHERLIRENFRLNRVCPNLTMAAVARQNGESAFRVERDFWTSHLDDRKGIQTISVKTVALNEQIERICPTFLIVDIEGGELFVARNLIAPTVRCIMVEIHPAILGEGGCADVIAGFADKGFHLAAREGDQCVFSRNPAPTKTS